MSETTAFALVCEHLERATRLDRAAARGTVRLALREAGLDPAHVSPRQMKVVVETRLPAELRSLRIGDVEGHTTALVGRLRRLQNAPTADAR